MKTHATAAQVARFCDLITNGKNIADFEGSRNGLQYKGTRPVRKVGAAVDAGAKVFAEAALDAKFAPETFEPATLTRPAAQPTHFQKL